MNQAFIIMQIGQPELDNMYGDVIVPALETSGLDAKRVDKHNEGGLLKSEIVDFIRESDIIVADLTNERPNCYLEIGYTMGMEKFENLILTCREDHQPESPNHQPNGPKVHFDLAGYDILFWDPAELEAFRIDLTKKVRRRLRLVSRTQEAKDDLWADSWYEEQTDIGKRKLLDAGFSGGMRIAFNAVEGLEAIAQPQLKKAAEAAQINSFGWPIGVVLQGKDAPKPMSDGIVTEIRFHDFQVANYVKNSFDYWALRENGDFSLVKSIYEDEMGLPKRGIFYDTRIIRTAETLLFCQRLYSLLGLSEDMDVGVQIEFFGLEGRILSASEPSRDLRFPQVCTEEKLVVEIREQLGALQSDLTELTKELLRPLFVLFEYHEFPDSIYEKLVGDFLKNLR